MAHMAGPKGSLELERPDFEVDYSTQRVLTFAAGTLIAVMGQEVSSRTGDIPGAAISLAGLVIMLGSLWHRDSR